MALRLFVINFVFLILPAFIWLTFFFEKSHKDDVTSTLYHMENLAYSHAARIEEHVTFCENMLTILINKMDLAGPETLNPDQLKLQFQKALVAAPEFENIIYSKKNENGRFIIWATNRDLKSPIDVTNLLFLTSALQKGKSMTLAFGFENQLWIYITKAIRDEKNNITGALTMAYDPHVLLKQVLDYEYSTLDTNFALITKSGIIFAADIPSLEMTSLYPLTKQQLAELTVERQNPPKIRDLPVIPLDIPPFKGVFERKIGGKRRIAMTWPLPDSNVMLAVGVNEEAVLKPFYMHLLKSIGILAPLCLLSLLIIWFLVKRLSEPLAQFMNLMSKVGTDNLQARFVKDEVGYEINEVGDAINRMLDKLLIQIETIKNETVKQKIATEELKIGHQIQQKILPSHLPVIEHFAMAGIAKPALEVGGDFYDIFLEKESEGGKLLVTIADGAGKGIPACLYALSLRNMLRGYAMYSQQVGTTIKEANTLLCQDTQISSMFVTVFMGLFDPKTLQFDYYSAGHLPALLKHSDGTIEKLWTPGIPLGIAPIEKIEQKSIQLRAGDQILLYTDGITEAMNGASDLFGEERLMSFFKNKTLATPDETLKAFMDELTTFTKEAEQNDDITAVLIYVS